MSFLNLLLFRIYYVAIIYIYPFYNILFSKKEKIWVIYFLILGFYYLIESKFLIIFKPFFEQKTIYILKTIKALFFLWLYHPISSGALLLDYLLGKLIDKIFSSLNPIIGQPLNKLGFPNKALFITDIKYHSDEEESPLMTKEEEKMKKIIQKR